MVPPPNCYRGHVHLLVWAVTSLAPQCRAAGGSAGGASAEGGPRPGCLCALVPSCPKPVGGRPCASGSWHPDPCRGPPKMRRTPPAPQQPADLPGMEGVEISDPRGPDLEDSGLGGHPVPAPLRQACPRKTSSASGLPSGCLSSKLLKGGGLGLVQSPCPLLYARTPSA